MNILGFDPGKDKCGLAVVDKNRQILFHQVIVSEDALQVIQSLSKRFSVQLLVMGNQTTSKAWKAKIENCISFQIVLVDEHNSTLEARDRYWLMYPPQGLQKLIPQGMRIPPRPVDDIVAILLVERYLQQV
ncbi:pre-16S rRNA-processing nuclease YqgF [Chroococcus sp. FPU101]|uniref:pre-16S rRNA-processing nuclease YqgF n=1 Tax=Chroococcus sp. FPU101 TaxID=1974212 RepID=UPI001A8E9667|nr:pre-16S rRNA-processing nuclease YqgF [Chroococcus sp. FPU101]GFE70710.1 resolvase RNase H domain protein fold protein [Chroococcus sp. FPU101]